MGWPRRLVLFLSPGGTASRAPRCFISLLSWGPEEVQMSISSPARHHRILSGPDISLCCSRKMTPVLHQACAFGNCSSVHLFVIPKQRFSPKQLVSWRSGDVSVGTPGVGVLPVSNRSRPGVPPHVPQCTGPPRGMIWSQTSSHWG